MLQSKILGSTDSEFLQVIFCQQWKHWIAGTTINCEGKEVKVYDALFSCLDQESLNVVTKLYMFASQDDEMPKTTRFKGLWNPVRQIYNQGYTLCTA